MLFFIALTPRRMTLSQFQVIAPYPDSLDEVCHPPRFLSYTCLAMGDSNPTHGPGTSRTVSAMPSVDHSCIPTGQPTLGGSRLLGTNKKYFPPHQSPLAYRPSVALL